MPNGHISTVNQDRLFLIASILDGTPINIGQIIETQIHHCAARTVGEMFFPSLITLMCQRVGITSPSHLQSPYTAGTITLVDIKRLLSVSETVSHPPPLASATPASHSLHPSSASEIASSSSTTTPPSVVDAASDSATETANDPPPSPIEVSDTERPAIPSKTSTAPTRRSNRVRARYSSPSSRKSSSSRLPTARRRVILPMSPPPPVDMSAPILPDINTAPPVPPAVFTTDAPMLSVPPAPSTSALPSPISPDQTMPPAPAPPPAQSALHPLRNHLVDILCTLFDNQALFFDYVLACDQHLQTLLNQLFRRLFGIEPSPWLPAPAYQSGPNLNSADHPPAD